MDIGITIFLWGFFSLIGIAIQVLIIRAGTRANKSIELLTSICESQNKQFLLLQKVIENKLGVTVNDEFYYHTSAVEAVAAYSVNDLFQVDNTLNEYVITKLAKLYEQHREELNRRGSETKEAIAVFAKYIDAFSKELTAEQWEQFLSIYNKKRQTIRDE